MRRAAPFSVLLLALSIPAFCGDKEVIFDSIPAGAQVELEGRVVGTTPLKWKFPNYWFGRKSMAWSAHSSQPLQIRLTKEGFTPKVLTVTTGPIHWRSFNGVNQYDYYLLSSTEFTVKLDSIQQFFPSAQAAEARTMSTAASPAPHAVSAAQLSTEEVARLERSQPLL
jgi:hypothetical protein